MSDNYAFELPSPAEIKERLSAARENWQPRQDFIKSVKAMLDGSNDVKAPETTQYEVIVTHTYLLLSAIQEKVARFMSQPQVAVVPNDASHPARSRSTELEEAINSAFYWMEANGDGDVWSKVVFDAVAYDQGVERIECAPAAFWPEITIPVLDKEGSPRERLSLFRPFEDPKEYTKVREDYKKECGVPIRTVYVPIQNFFPVYEGPTPVECFELEQRSVREINANPIFDRSAVAQITAANSRLSASEKIKKKVTILHYVNQQYHAYYALVPGQKSSTWPDPMQGFTDDMIGEPVLLHAYKHKLGKVIYNIVGGRFGGWKTQHNDIEMVMKACVQLNQDADRMASQVATNHGALYWPNFVVEYDPERRTEVDSPPDPPQLTPGQSIGIWKGERLVPLFQPAANPMFQWHYEQILSQMERLTGGRMLFGQNEPGVRTGYHANLQVTQAEHLDDKIDQHLVKGVTNRGYLFLDHVVAMDEKTWVFHKFVNKKGYQQGQYIPIDPKALRPKPELDGIVRKPRPIDYNAALNAARLASEDRAGPGTPLLDDDTIWERILGEDAPDEIRKKIAIQTEQRKLMDSGLLSELIGKRMVAELAKRSAPSVSPEQAAAADPMLYAAMGGQLPMSPEMGGVSPELMGAIMQGTGGPPPAPPVPAGGVPQVQPAPAPGGPPAPQPYGPQGLQGQGGGALGGQPQPGAVIANAVRMAR